MGDQVKTAAEAVEADALPRVHEVHADPATLNAGNNAVPSGVAKTPLQKKRQAQWAYERLIIYLKNFEEQLDNEHEAAMGFVGGEAGVLKIEGMGYYDPDTVTFYGTDPAGGRTQLVQHVTQLNVMLRAVPKDVEKAEPNCISFRLAQDLDDDNEQPVEGV